MLFSLVGRKDTVWTFATPMYTVIDRELCLGKLCTVSGNFN